MFSIKKQSKVVHYLIRAAVLAGYTFYVMYLISSEKLHYYIAPSMIPHVKWGAVILFLLAGYTVYLAIQEGDKAKKQEAHHTCGCQHEPPQSVIRSIGLYSLFIIPLLLGYMMPDQIMASSVVAVKGINLEAGAESNVDVAPSPNPIIRSAFVEESANQSSQLDQLFPADEYALELAELGKKMYEKEIIYVKEDGFMEMLTTLDLYKENFIGRTVVLSGFVYREDDMQTNQFALSRIAMQCCSADAMPYGLLVDAADSSDLADDTWIEVTGRIGTTMYRDREIIQLEIIHIEPIETPGNPYVYYYLGDYTELVED